MLKFRDFGTFFPLFFHRPFQNGGQVQTRSIALVHDILNMSPEHPRMVDHFTYLFNIMLDYIIL